MYGRREADLSDANLVNADFRPVQIRDELPRVGEHHELFPTKLEGVKLKKSRLLDADLRNADLRKVKRLRGLQVAEANSDDVTTKLSHLVTMERWVVTKWPGLVRAVQSVKAQLGWRGLIGGAARLGRRALAGPVRGIKAVVTKFRS